MADMTPLRRRMIEDMQVRNLSPVTQRCYVHAVAKFAQHFNRSPSRLGWRTCEPIKSTLASTGISWAGFNVAVALRFFYRVTLGRTAMVERIPYARKRRQLPVILSADEVVRFFSAVPSLKHRTALMTAYAAGLRDHAVAATARRAARLLARLPAGSLAVSRLGRKPAPRRECIAGGLPHRAGDGEARQAGHRSHPAPQLRHPSARSGHRHPHDPAAARASRPVDHGTLHPGRRHRDWQHDQPVRSTENGAGRSGLSRGVRPRSSHHAKNRLHPRT
jgi:hypothetical protein